MPTETRTAAGGSNTPVRPPLPDGWRWARLGEACDVNPRRPGELTRPSDAPTTFVPMSAVSERTGTIISPEVRPYSELRQGFTFFRDGDVLFAKITPCMQNGKHAVVRNAIDGLGFGSTEFHVLRPGPPITAEWLHRFLRQPRVLREAAAHFTGSVGQQRVPDSFLRELSIPLPPVTEQRRILAILDEQMAAVERARAAAEAQLQAARALPAAYLRAVFESDEARGWPVSRLGEISEITGGLQKTPDRTPTKHHAPYLTVRNVQRGYLDLSAVERFEVSPAELARLRLVSGDLLIVEGNGSLDHIGRNALFHGEIEDCIHQNHIIRVRCSPDALVPQFVSRFLNSDQGRAQMVARAKTTSGLYTLSTGKVASLEIPVPSREEQRRIADSVNEHIAAADHLCAAAEAQLDAVSALPAALLRRAFSGGL